MRRKLVFTFVIVVLVVSVLAACSTATPPPPTSGGGNTTGGGADGAALLNARCTACHGVDQVSRQRLSRADWDTVITKMVNRGAKLDAAEKAALLDYLAKTYAP